MNPLGVATGLFTVIPVRPFDVDRGTARRAMAGFPWLGLLIGAAWWVGGLGAALAAAIGLAAASLVGALWAWHLLRRLGGWTGDTFGSLIEVTQLVFLVAFALAA